MGAQIAELAAVAARARVKRLVLLGFIGTRSVATLTVEQTWDGRAADMIDAGKRQAAKLARQY
jgi:hypothetical protein